MRSNQASIDRKSYIGSTINTVQCQQHDHAARVSFATPYIAVRTHPFLIPQQQQQQQPSSALPRASDAVIIGVVGWQDFTTDK